LLKLSFLVWIVEHHKRVYNFCNKFVFTKIALGVEPQIILIVTL